MTITLYVVGRHLKPEEAADPETILQGWRMTGIFTRPGKAESACHDDQHFYFAIHSHVDYSKTKKEPVLIYPLRRFKKCAPGQILTTRA